MFHEWEVKYIEMVNDSGVTKENIILNKLISKNKLDILWKMFDRKGKGTLDFNEYIGMLYLGNLWDKGILPPSKICDEWWKILENWISNDYDEKLENELIIMISRNDNEIKEELEKELQQLEREILFQKSKKEVLKAELEKLKKEENVFQAYMRLEKWKESLKSVNKI